MIVILFRSRLTSQAADGYGEMSDRMFALARASAGFVDMRSYVSEDGERLTLVWWRDLETLSRWRRDERHREAQETGRARWYEHYDMEVAEVVRESHFRRPAESGANEPSEAAPGDPREPQS